MPDKLDRMFAMQRKLNRHIGIDTDNLLPTAQNAYILSFTRAMTQEVAELVDSCAWKWWTDYQQYNQQNARVEIADLFHFLISLAQVVGLSPAELFSVYEQKYQVNIERLESGYREKVEDCTHITPDDIHDKDKKRRAK